MKEKLKLIIEKVTDILFVKDISCIVCGDDIFNFDRNKICEKCFKKLPFVPEKICLRCGMPVNTMANYCFRCKNVPYTFKKARSAFIYESPINQLVQKLKFENAKYLFEPLAYFMAETYLLEKFDCDLITFVPLFDKREKSRGYNQAQLLASELSKIIKIPVIKCLSRSKETLSQTTLSRKERETNLEKAFKAENKTEFKNKNVLLVDDVFTTGSTLEECSKVLSNYGAKNIYCLCVAHTYFKKYKTSKNNDLLN